MSKSSLSYGKFWNLVESVEDTLVDDQLTSIKLFLFTDNSVTDINYYRVTSKIKIIFQMVSRLQKMKWREP